MTPPSAGQAAVPNERALLYTLAGVQFTHIVDFMVMMPLGPQFTQLFAISDAQFGLLVSAYTFAAGAAGLLASGFIDRFERKRLLLMLYAGFALATLACGLAPTYGFLMAARITAGLFGGVLTAMVQTIIGDAIPFERRGNAMGIVMASFSLATVAGVPLSLWIADALGWHASFIAIALASGVIALVGLRSLPTLDQHLHAAAMHGGASGSLPMRPRLGGVIAEVLRDPQHWRAFGFTALVMSAGFSIIPYLTIFMTSNAGLPASQVPMVYLVGGVATLVTSRLIGAAADRWGKVTVFRAVAAMAMVPLMGITLLSHVPLAVLLTVSTLFFVFVSGRMVPGMALITESAVPRLRGTFMSLNGAVQSGTMGLASLVGGLLIGRDAAGQVIGYERCGLLAVVLSVAALWMVGRLRAASADPARAGTAQARA